VLEKIKLYYSSKDYYRLGINNYTRGNYVSSSFDETLTSISECGLRINKSDYEIQPHFYINNISISPCNSYEIAPSYYYDI
jgi:hypothetical protein